MNHEKEYFKKVAEYGQLVILAGPDAVGRRTVLRQYLAQHPNATQCTTVTTREPRENEVDGREHFFISHKEFDQMIRTHQLIDYHYYKRNGYGTPIKQILDARAAGHNVLLLEDVEDAMRVRSRIPDCTLIFLMSPTWDKLEERIRARHGQDPEALNAHILHAQEQILCAGQFDYILINDCVEKTVRRLGEIIHGNRYSRNSMKAFVESYIESEIHSDVADILNQL